MKGSDAEHLAAQFLQRQHLILIEKNYRCRFGEIDLIMRDDTVLVFVEVRMRSNNSFGGAAASITTTKQGKLIRAARHYLTQLNVVPACRFDVVLLTGTHNPEIQWIENAFGE